jgi:diguanylate cyclase (GGDEF)-like protein/PAS domain S-box-containing protein
MTKNPISIEAIADALPAMVAYWDKNLLCRYANKPYEVWFGKNASTVVGMTIQTLLGEKLFKLNEPFIIGALKGQKQNFERTLIKADGSISFVWANYIPDIDEAGSVLGFYILVTDITQLKKSQTELKIAASVYANTLAGIIATNKEQIVLSINPAFTRITQYSNTEAIGRPLSFLRASEHDHEFFKNLWRTVETVGKWEGDVWTRGKDGTAFLSSSTIIKVEQNDESEVEYLIIFYDITNIRSADNKLKQLAFHDQLTNLPNRTLFIDRLEQLISQSEHAQQELGVMFLDLDGFKAVNDTYGHDTGDVLLKLVAQKIQSMISQYDTVARLGGDEFVILLDLKNSTELIDDICNRIIQLINEPIEIFNQKIQVGASIGISIYPHDGKTKFQLMKNADSAMYRSKTLGKNTFSFFNPK